MLLAITIGVLIVSLFLISLKVSDRLRKIWFVSLYEIGMKIFESTFNIMRERSLNNLQFEKSTDPVRSQQGEMRILEIGPASGKNFRYYPNYVTQINLICVEPNEYFRKYLDANLKKFTNINLENFYKIGAENMKVIEDESIDVVIGTYVLCKVPDIESTLKEIKRVLIKGGKYYYLEHVKDPKQSLSFFQRILKFFRKTLGHGSVDNRNPDRSIRNAGFEQVSQYSGRFPSKFLFPAPYNIYGIAIK